MKQMLFFMVIILAVGVGCENFEKQGYQPTFESLEEIDPAPEWFKDAKFGIYFHWGAYSVPAYANEWYPRSMNIEGTDEYKHHVETYGTPEQWPYHYFITGAEDNAGNYMQFAPRLASDGGNFDPEEWAQLFVDAGARFAGPVAEHHDGFSMWASQVNPWNTMDMGPKLDLTGLLVDAIRKKNMKVILSMHHAYNITGYYESVPETNDPMLRMLYGQQGEEKNEALWLAKHKEIIDMYQPDIIWQDFNLHIISQPVRLQFLSYYYNQAALWNKEVVATYKDGLNTKCAVLDYERGGPVDITENYWLTDDAVSSSSWSYTEGIGYYSEKQVLHGFLDRISKNGNLLLNISPKADGTIPREQRDILLAMGDWLKKYGEAVYATRAWERYGEGPTKMGAEHGVFMEPEEGTADDIRYTRSKDNTTVYAIMLGWDDERDEISLQSLSSDRIDIKNLKTVELINGATGNYTPASFRQDAGGLRVNLPEKPGEELAYVLKLSFDGTISPLDKYVDVNSTPDYHILPGSYMNNPVLGANLTLNENRKDPANQWKFEPHGKGLYAIRNGENRQKVLTYYSSDASGQDLTVSHYTGEDNQLWKIEATFNALYAISSKQSPNQTLSISGSIEAGEKSEITYDAASPFGWRLIEVCTEEQRPFGPNSIPGVIEGEDFDHGCLGEAFFDIDEVNHGGKYRKNQPVDIDTCSAGTYLVGWTNEGEWLAYTVNVLASSTYQVSFYVATIYDTAKLRLTCDGIDITGSISVPNTAGFQNWTVVKQNVNLEAGTHILKLHIDSGGFNIDKMIFEEAQL
jgi:alpha-L-fucosidase